MIISRPKAFQKLFGLRTSIWPPVITVIYVSLLTIIT